MFIQHKVIKHLNEYTTDQLCQFTVPPDMRHLYNKKRSVLEILNAGKLQVHF